MDLGRHDKSELKSLILECAALREKFKKQICDILRYIKPFEPESESFPGIRVEVDTGLEAGEAPSVRE